MKSDAGRCNFSLARSGGDALKLGDSWRPPLQAREVKPGFDIKRAKTDKHGAGQTEWIDEIASCPVYYPTMEEFRDPLHYIQSIAPEASKYGMCKIVSPLVVSVSAGVVLTKEQAGFRFTTRIQPLRLADWVEDDKIAFPMSGRHYSLTSFEKMANRAFARRFSTAASLPARFVEEEFWKELVAGKTRTVEYACDVEGSAFSVSPKDPLAQSKWNLKGFSRLSKSTLRLLESAIPGVTEPMLYIGMLFSMFAWHVEDHYLYSINYHHCGAAKTWYGVPGDAASAFEKVVREHVYNLANIEDAEKDETVDLLLGKTTMFAPKLLSEHGVPVFRTVQNPGELVITFPQAYHSGFSHGFNCGEAVNFAMADWFPFGSAACQLYECLNRIPLLPHEELLCKEAVALCSSCSDDEEPVNSGHDCLKASFLSLICSQRQMQTFMTQQGAQIIQSNVTNVLCGICKHTCYIAYISCKCHSEPICFNHGKQIYECRCGSDRSVFIRENHAELEGTAKKFECENRITTASGEENSVIDSSTVIAWQVEEQKGSQIANELCQQHLHLNSDAHDLKISGGVSISNLSSHTSQNVSEKQESHFVVSVCKREQEEEESDTEAFRVKRRRVLSARSNSIYADEHSCLMPEQLEEGTPDGDKEHPSNSQTESKGGKLRWLLSKSERYQVLIDDIINELDIEGPTPMVIQQWQADALNQGMSLKIKKVCLDGKVFEALSLKGCERLKKILTGETAVKLSRLVRNLPGKSKCSKVASTGDLSCKDFGMAKEISQLEPHLDNTQVKMQRFSEQKETDFEGALKLSAVSTEEETPTPSNAQLIMVQKSLSTETTLLGGDTKKDLKVSRLIVRGPTPPAGIDIGRKRTRPLVDDGNVNVIRGQGLKKFAEVSEPKSGLFEPDEDDCMVKVCDEPNKKEREVVTDVIAVSGKQKKENISECVPKRGLIVHLKVDKARILLAAPAVGTSQEKEGISKCLEVSPEQVENSEASRRIPAVCPEKEAVNPLSGHEEIERPTEEPKQQPSLTKSFDQELLQDDCKDQVSGTSALKCWNQSDMLADDSLEEGELKEMRDLTGSETSNLLPSDKKPENYSESSIDLRRSHSPPFESGTFSRPSSGLATIGHSHSASLGSEEQKLWQAEDLEVRTNGFDEHEVVSSQGIDFNHQEWYYLQNQGLSEKSNDELLNRLSSGVVQCREQYILGFAQRGSDSNHMQRNECRFHKKLLSSNGVDHRSTEVREQRGWHRARKTSCGITKTGGWTAPGQGCPGFASLPSPVRGEKNINFIKCDRRRSGPARADKVASLPKYASRPNTFHSHYHHPYPRSHLRTVNFRPHPYPRGMLHLKEQKPGTHSSMRLRTADCWAYDTGEGFPVSNKIRIKGAFNRSTVGPVSNTSESHMSSSRTNSVKEF